MIDVYHVFTALLMVQRKDPSEHEPAAVALRRYAIHDVAYILLMVWRIANVSHMRSRVVS